MSPYPAGLGVSRCFLPSSDHHTALDPLSTMSRIRRATTSASEPPSSGSRSSSTDPSSFILSSQHLISWYRNSHLSLASPMSWPKTWFTKSMT